MNTTKLNRNNARAENWVKSYFNSSFYGVKEFYNRPSYNKIRAEKECIDRMLEVNGKSYRVLSGNSSFFTCGYLSNDEKTLYIETHCNTFEIAL